VTRTIGDDEDTDDAEDGAAKSLDGSWIDPAEGDEGFMSPLWKASAVGSPLDSPNTIKIHPSPATRRRASRKKYAAQEKEFLKSALARASLAVTGINRDPVGDISAKEEGFLCLEASQTGLNTAEREEYDRELKEIEEETKRMQGEVMSLLQGLTHMVAPVVIGAAEKDAEEFWTGMHGYDLRDGSASASGSPHDHRGDSCNIHVTPLRHSPESSHTPFSKKTENHTPHAVHTLTPVSGFRSSIKSQERSPSGPSRKMLEIALEESRAEAREAQGREEKMKHALDELKMQNAELQGELEKRVTSKSNLKLKEAWRDSIISLGAEQSLLEEFFGPGSCTDSASPEMSILEEKLKAVSRRAEAMQARRAGNSGDVNAERPDVVEDEIDAVKNERHRHEVCFRKICSVLVELEEKLKREESTSKEAQQKALAMQFQAREATMSRNPLKPQFKRLVIILL